MKTKRVMLGGILIVSAMLNAQTGLLITSGTSGQSGLKFANFNSGSTLSSHPGSILAVNSSGDVILVPDLQGSGTFGGANNGCRSNSNVVELGDPTTSGTTSGKLLVDRRVHQDNHRIVFTGDLAGDIFHIGSDWTGSSPSAAPDARLFVENHKVRGTSGLARGIEIFADAGSTIHNAGLYSKVRDNNSSPATQNIGAYLDVVGTGSQVGTVINVSSTSSGSNIAYGADITVTGGPNGTSTYKGINGLVYAGNSSSTNNYAIGADFIAASANYNYGGIFRVTAGGSGISTPSISVGTQGFVWDGSQNSYGGWFVSSSGINQNTFKSIGAKCEGVGSVLNIGVNAFADNTTAFTNPSKNYGVYSIAQGKSSADNYGVYAEAGNYEIASYTTKLNVGVRAIAHNYYQADTNYALWASVDPVVSPTQNYARKNIAARFDGDVLIRGSHDPAHNGFNNPGTIGTAFYVDGDSEFWGDGFFNTTFMWSDKRFKTNFKPLESTLKTLEKIKGYTYNYKVDEFKYKGFSSKEQIGFIAQELQAVYPQLINEDKNGYLAVNYQGFIPVLLEAIKEQQNQFVEQEKKTEEQKTTINNLQQQLDELKASIALLSASNQQRASASSIATNVSSKNVIVLNQNVPNPFAESTVITYNIPNAFTNAQIIFTTTNGQVFKTVEIKQSGEGSLTIYGNDLTHGMYTYTLKVDDKIIDSHKMIKD